MALEAIAERSLRLAAGALPIALIPYLFVVWALIALLTLAEFGIAEFKGLAWMCNPD